MVDGSVTVWNTAVHNWMACDVQQFDNKESALKQKDS